MRWVRAGPLGALVSDLPGWRVRPDRRAIAAHERTVRAVPAVLPFSFGTVAREEKEVVSLLVLEREALLAALRRVAGAREFRISATWAVEDLAAYVLSRDPDLGRLRDRAFAGGRRPGRDEMIEIGAAFAAARERLRRDDTEAVRAALAPLCRETADLGAKGERGAVDLGCLVDAEREEAFGGAVAALARRLDERYVVTLTGPFPPYDFADLRLSLAGAS